MDILKCYEESDEICESAEVYYDGEEWIRVIFHGSVEWEDASNIVQIGTHLRHAELEREYDITLQKLKREEKLNRVLKCHK